jgi:branched-subunit amino acid aminotransferase/4-amino-4-deoxychorismate lyase
MGIGAISPPHPSPIKGEGAAGSLAFGEGDIGNRKVWISVVAEPLAYLNGRLLRSSHAHIAVYDAGVVMGATVSEQTRTFGKKLFRLRDHLDRLFHSLHVAGLHIDLTIDDLTAISEELVAYNGRLIRDRDELGLIHFISAGERSVYAAPGVPTRAGPTICAHTYRLPFQQWAKKMRQGAHLITPTVRQMSPACWDPAMKCRSRMHYYLADKEAQAADPDAIALLLDLEGRVTETNAANFLMVQSGEILSPPREYILPGISRDTVIEMAKDIGIPFIERDVREDDFAQAEEAFLSSTGFCLMPVTRINRAAIGNGNPGAVYRRLIAEWSRKVGVDIVEQIAGGDART